MRLQRLILCVLALLVLTAGAAVPAYADDSAEFSRIVLRLWPSAHRVQMGNVVAFELIVNNEGTARARNVVVTLPYVKEQMALLRPKTKDEGVWISELTDDRVVITFNNVPSSGEQRIELFFQVAPKLPENLPITVRASGEYRSNGVKQRARSNQVVVYAVSSADVTPQVTVAPQQGQAGTIFTFTIKNYFPKEQVFTWFNTPDGRAIDSGLAGRADGQGTAVYSYDSRPLPPGKYSLVAYGQISKITTLVEFTIE